MRVELRSQFGFRIIFQWFVRLELSVTVFADSSTGIVAPRVTILRLRFGMDTVSHRSDSAATPVDFKLHHHPPSELVDIPASVEVVYGLHLLSPKAAH